MYTSAFRHHQASKAVGYREISTAEVPIGNVRLPILALWAASQLHRGGKEVGFPDKSGDPTPSFGSQELSMGV